MRLENLPRSKNVRGSRGSRRRGPVMLGGGGCGMIIIMLLLVFVFKVDPTALLQQGGGGGVLQQQSQQQESSLPHSQEALQEQDFIRAVLGGTETIWASQFQRVGKSYRPAKLEIFSGRVNTACGPASSAVGPFYCPGDHKIYIDPLFFDQMSRDFNVEGDFAHAYVIAHEVGHHMLISTLSS